MTQEKQVNKKYFRQNARACLLALKPLLAERTTQRDGKVQAAVRSLTGILDLDSGVGLGVGLVNHLSADLLRQNLHGKID